MSILEKLDGTGRKPRPQQKKILEDKERNFDSGMVDCYIAPTGSGKSMVAMSIAKYRKGMVITPSNPLVNQYIEGYPHANFLQGKGHYTCRYGVSCGDWTGPFGQKPCEGCPYTACKTKALAGVPTIFNPMSYHYTFLRAGDRYRANSLIVDEAHQLQSMLNLLTSRSFPEDRYDFTDECLNQVYLQDWIKQTKRKLSKLMDVYRGRNTETARKRLTEISDSYQTLANIGYAMEDTPELFASYIETRKSRGRKKRYLSISSVKPVPYVTDKFFRAKDITFLSATMFETDIRDLTGDKPSRTLEVDSPIPARNRRIIYRPTSFKINYATDPAKLARSLEEILSQHRGENTIIHVPYSLQARLVPHMKTPVLHNTSLNKDAVLKKFIRNGGVFLASGCAEGLDLKDDLCRVNIVPKLMYPNLKDPVVSKRKALEDGEEWYFLETLKTLIQQLGRSVRHENDWSHLYCTDPSLPWLLRKVWKHVPQFFKDALNEKN